MTHRAAFVISSESSHHVGMTNNDTKNTPSLTEVIAFIEKASATEVDLIKQAITTSAARKVVVGAKVEVHGISPKYLVGLTGTIKTISHRGKGYVSIMLDETSTIRYRMKNRGREVPEGATSYELGGIPLACARPVD